MPARLYSERIIARPCALVLTASMSFLFAALPAESAGASAAQIVFGAPWEPLGFNPLRALDSGSYAAQTLVYEGLVKYDANLNIVPAVAKRFSVSGDELSYAFELREEARFSDGSAVSVDDVIASIQLARSSLSPYKADFACIKRIEKSGKSGLVLDLDKRSAPFLARLVDLRVLPGRIISRADHGNGVLGSQPLGSGPFRLTRWESGLELVFEPNPYYWAGPPAMSRLVWRVVPDKTLLAIAMRRGELDVAAIDPATWFFLDADGKAARSHLKLEQLSGSRTVYLGFNLHRKPFDDLLVREAIAESIDRQQLVSRFYGNLAVVPLTDVPAGSWAFNREARSRPFDCVAAARALRVAGYALCGGGAGRSDRQDAAHSCWGKNGKLLAFRILTVRDLQDVAQIVADDLVRMHIACEVQIMEYATLRARYLRSGDFDVMLWSRSSGPDPECTLVWKTKGALNFSGFSDPAVDALIEAGRSAQTVSERMAIYGKIQSALAKQLPWVFLVQPNLLLVHRDNIENVQQGRQTRTGVPWDNPVFNASNWRPVPSLGASIGER